jgi:hypothetical protein
MRLVWTRGSGLGLGKDDRSVKAKQTLEQTAPLTDLPVATCLIPGLATPVLEG